MDALDILKELHKDLKVHSLENWSDRLLVAIQELENPSKQIENNANAIYSERNQAVAALAKCFPSGLKKTEIEGWDPEWHGCVYIDLPTGQVSWHYHDSDAYLFDGLPTYLGSYDGHSTEEKYARLNKLHGPERPWRPITDHEKQYYAKWAP